MGYKSVIKPWKHQMQVTKRLNKMGSALLWANVGTGKTKAVIDHVLAKKIRKTLVVGPLAAIGVWKRQFLEHDPNIHIVTSNDVSSHDELIPLIHKARKSEQQVVIVLTYNAITKLVKLLADSYVPDLFVVDESHYIRKYSATRTKRALALSRSSANTICLSGTPAPNGYEDLYYQIKAVHPGILPSTMQGFKDEYCRMGGFMGRDIVGYKNVKRLARKLSKVTIRVTDAVLNLPEAVDHVVPVTLEPKAMKFYKDLETDYVASIDDVNIDVDNHLVGMLRCMQITGGMIEGKQISKAKINVFKDIVAEEKGKFVVFCQFVQEIKLITEVLESLGITYEVLRGGKSGKVRSEIEDRFQSEDDPRAIIAQIDAGGVAITLTAAATAIFYSLNYKSDVYEQARGRIRRGTQREVCRYIHLLAEDTIDFDVYNAVNKKMNVQALLSAVVRRVAGET